MEDIPDTHPETVVDDVPFIGTLDIVLLILLAIASIYYFWLKDRNKKEEISALSQFTVNTDHLPNRTDSGFVTKMKTSGRKVVVFYGSQTGTGEEFACRLAKEASRWGMKGMVADPEECDMTELNQMSEIENHLVIFCMATYGEGDPTDNAQEFYQMIEGDDLQLKGVQYTVFALGNKTYEHYNATGKKVDERLEELGATRLFPMGMGDDDANMEDDFIVWKDAMWPKVCEVLGMEALTEDINMRQYRLVLHDDYNPEKIFKGEIGRLKSMIPGSQRPPFDSKNPFMAAITENRELHRAGDRNCMHIELEVTGSRIRYECGDHVAIYPVNESYKVERLCTLLNEKSEKIFSLKNLDEDSIKKVPFPCPCSYRTALLHYVDINAIPRTHILKEISEYTTDEQEKARLVLMSSSSEEGRAAYQKWVVGDVRNIIHILEDLPSCKPPLDYICELLPRLQARYYSISSTPKTYPNAIHITAVVLSYETPTLRTNDGVCTNWLKNKQIVSTQEEPFHIPIFVRKSQFRLPIKVSTPILMIGPGTGIAPFRGFIHERSWHKLQGTEVGETVLYYGCRHKKEDYIYEDELTDYVEQGLLKLHVAFSRDQDQKVYVTHLLEENKADVWRLIGVDKANVYVCGDAKVMARDVHNLITNICETEGKMTKVEAELYVKNMVNTRRYSSDVWS